MSSNGLPDLAGKTIHTAVGQITLHETLGSGSFGRVFRGKSANGTPFAVKVMPLGAPKTTLGDAQAKELSIHNHMGKFPNIVTLHTAIRDDDFIYMVMEYCSGGDLSHHLRDHSFFGDTDGVKRIFGQVVDAVQSCHALGAFHRDLKLDNILMSKDGQKAYLSDFGLSTTAPSSERTVGTRSYESPECVLASSERAEFEHAPNDVWALGVILCCMIGRRQPWKVADATDPYFVTFFRDPRWLYDSLPISEEAFQLLKDIFNIDPRVRPTVPELKERVADMETFFRDPKMDSAVPAGEAEVVHVELSREDDDVLVRDMGKLEVVATPLVCDDEGNPKWRDRVKEKINLDT